MHAERDKWFEIEYNVSAFITSSSQNNYMHFWFLAEFSKFITMQCFKIKLEFP